MDYGTLIDNLLVVMPIIVKKILKDVKFENCSKQQVGLLFALKKDDNKPMSFYSEKLILPKPNLTVMADKLFDDGFVERMPDGNDRRIVFLKLTEKGRIYIDDVIDNVKEQIAAHLDKLDEKDIGRLNESVDILLTILNKLES